MNFTAIAATGIAIAIVAFFLVRKPTAPVNGDAAAAGAPRFTPSTEPWVDRMNDPVIATKGSLKREGTAWRLNNITQFTFPEVMTDGAVRLLFAMGNDGTSSSVSLRRGGLSGPKSLEGYHLGFYKAPTLQIHRDQKFTSLGRGVVRFPPSVPQEFFGHPIEVELRAVGSRITAKVNGEVVASADDTTFKSGICAMQLSAGTVIYGVQTLNLSKPAPIPVVAGVAPKFSPSTEPWQDRMAEIPMDKAKREGTGVRFDSLWHWKLLPGFTDGAVRFLFTPGPMKQDAGLHLRVNGANERNSYGFGATPGYCTLQSGGNPSRGLAPVVTHEKSIFAQDKVVEMELRAVGTHIEGKLNGKKVFAVDDNAFSSGFARVVIPAGTLVYGVQTLDLSKAKGAPSTPAPASDAALPIITGWQDVMETAKAAQKNLAKAEIADENGWAVLKASGVGAAALMPGKLSADPAVRGRTRGKVNINLRQGAPSPGFYVLALSTDGKGSLEIVRPSAARDKYRTVLKEFAIAAVPEHEFLFTAAGPDLRVWVDGQPVAQVRDTECTGSNVSMSLDVGSAFRDLAIADLPAPGK